ncbi:unnamed protein product, partial [Nesidiocoris tenuis]
MILSGSFINLILLNETRFSVAGSPVAHLTTLGWILMGRCNVLPLKKVRFQTGVKHYESPLEEHHNNLDTNVDSPTTSTSRTTLLHSSPTSVSLPPIPRILTISKSLEAELLHSVERFFDVEADPSIKSLSPDESLAEEIFRTSTRRLPDGRYSVALPLKDSPEKLGPSRSQAIRRLYSMERKFSNNPSLRDAYCQFMQDYLDQGHMVKVSPPAFDQRTYYLPHHSVHRIDDPPNKIRVVFNASFKTNTGYSLNDLLLPGPRLQLEIADVVTRFRLDRYVFTADVRQMFRQISHHLEDRNLLRIVWRFNPDSPIQDFNLCTVTYGTASAPWLANRVIKDLAQSHAESHPDASTILSNRVYVDDLNGGSNDIQGTIHIRNQLIDVLASAKLELRKWATNQPEILDGIPPHHRLPATTSLAVQSEKNFNSDTDKMKILGVSWNPTGDFFHYSPTELENVETKRDLLSCISQIYDPLGWLSPIVIKSRIVFRQVADQGFSWDSTLPPDVQSQWNKIQSQLPNVRNLRIPRYMSTSEESMLVGFCDASEQAYGCVIYVVSPQSHGNTVHLVSSKAK